MDNQDVISFASDGRARAKRTLLWRSGYSGKRQYDKIGGLAPHPVNWRRFQASASPRVHPITGNLIEVWGGDWTDPTSNLLPVSFRDNVRDTAARNWYKNISNTNALLPLMFKERQKTIDMIAEKIRLFGSIRRNFHNNLKRVIKRNKRSRHLVESRWLEYRYGWLPTLSDINTLANKPLGHPSARVVGYSQDFYSNEKGNGRLGRTVITATYTETYTASIIARNPGMVAATQYGVANPLLVVWEMVPFSFAVDWFLDIGGWAESVGALNGLEVISPSRSRMRTHNLVYSFDAQSKSYSSGYCNQHGSCGIRTLEQPSYPNPLIPSNGLNLTRLFDAVALCDTIFKRKP